MLALALGCYFISSCGGKNESSLSAATQKNLAANDSINKAFETKDFSRIGDFIAADAVDHSGEHGDIKGIDSLKAEFEKYVSEVSDEKIDVHKTLADDDYVMSWAHHSGTYAKDGMDHKAGDHFDIDAVEVSRFKDGKATEHWIFINPADMMKMMPPPVTDSAKAKK